MEGLKLDNPVFVTRAVLTSYNRPNQYGGIETNSVPIGKSSPSSQLQ